MPIGPDSLIKDNPNSIVLSGAIVAVAAIGGLFMGLTIEAVSRRKGRPTVARKVLKFVEHSIQGFALGSLAADYLAKLLSED